MLLVNYDLAQRLQQRAFAALLQARSSADVLQRKLQLLFLEAIDHTLLRQLWELETARGRWRLLLRWRLPSISSLTANQAHVTIKPETKQK